MSLPERYTPDEVIAPTQAPRLGIIGTQKHLKALGQVDAKAEIQARQVRNQAGLGAIRAQGVARVGEAAMNLQTRVSLTERLLVELEPGAINGLAHLSLRITLGLGAVLDRTIDEMTR